MNGQKWRILTLPANDPAPIQSSGFIINMSLGGFQTYRGGESNMQGKTGEHWRDLCERAAKEKDSERLMELVREINRMLSAKEERLHNQEQHQAPEQTETDQSVT